MTVLDQDSMNNNKTAIYMQTVSAPTNIACIKYWGKDSLEYNTPINSSVSITLDQTDLRAVTTASCSTSFPTDRLWLNGKEELHASTSQRFRACVDGVRALATDKIDPDTGKILVTKDQWKDMHVHISSYNTFPTAAGLASSAAGYAALVAALAKLFGAKETFEGELSTIARQGSGSACRSLYGGFVAWRKGCSENNWKDSLAEQIANEMHWPQIRALILVVSDAKKDTSSTSGMVTSVQTSSLLNHRAKEIVEPRMKLIEQAWHEKDFETFGKLTMMDSNQFHATCLDTYPPIFYMNDVSKSIIRIVHVYNSWAKEIRAAYTFDAGPNAVLYTLDNHVLELCALMLHYYPSFGSTTTTTPITQYMNNADFEQQAQQYSLDPELIRLANLTGRTPASGDVKKIYYTKSGPGPMSLGQDEAIIDPITGLNTYQP